MLLVTRVVLLKAGECKLEIAVMGYSGILEFDTTRHLTIAWIWRTDEGVLRSINQDSDCFSVFQNERNGWRDAGNDGQGYCVYFDRNTFRPIAKFHDPSYRHECIGTGNPFGVGAACWMQRLKNDPPFDFCGVAEEWKTCLEHIVKLELLVRGPDWRSVRVGMEI